MDMKLAALKTIKYVAKTQGDIIDVEKVQSFLPELIALLRDRNTSVKCTSEITLGFMLQLHKNDELFDVSLLYIVYQKTFYPGTIGILTGARQTEKRKIP